MIMTRWQPWTGTALVAGLLAAGCAGSQTRAEPFDPENTPVTTITYDFEPTVVQARIGEDGRIETRASDVPQLFSEANAYLRADDYEEALRLYDLVLEATFDEEYERVAHYNRALALEGMLEYHEAALSYAHVIRTWPASDDATYAHFRLAECFAQTGQYERVPALMERVLPRGGLALVDRLEAELRWGYALLEMRDFVGADEHLQNVIRGNQQALVRWSPESTDWRERPLERNDAILSQAWFGRGRIYHELFREVRLVLPEARLTEDLVAKTQLFEQSQEAYLHAVRSGNRYWAPAAGFMVGQLFEDFYYDVLATEVPPEFNEVELEVYFEELRAFIAPAMERAMGVYENNLAMAYRLGAEGVWVEDTLASIERIDQYLREREGWETEHRLIIEHRHPRSANYAGHMQFRSERSER
jgi:tetratricopeptide (TPR) repeat protein